MPTDSPPLARGLHSRKPATQEMWIQGKKPPFKPLGTDPFSANEDSECLRQASSPEAKDIGQAPKLQGTPLLCSLKYFLS